MLSASLNKTFPYFLHFVYVHMFVIVWVRVWAYVCMYVCMYVCVCMYMCVCVCVYVCVHIKEKSLTHTALETLYSTSTAGLLLHVTADLRNFTFFVSRALRLSHIASENLTRKAFLPVGSN